MQGYGECLCDVLVCADQTKIISMETSSLVSYTSLIVWQQSGIKIKVSARDAGEFSLSKNVKIVHGYNFLPQSETFPAVPLANLYLHDKNQSCNSSCCPQSFKICVLGGAFTFCQPGLLALLHAAEWKDNTILSLIWFIETVTEVLDVAASSAHEENLDRERAATKISDTSSRNKDIDAEELRQASEGARVQLGLGCFVSGKHWWLLALS